MLMGQIIGISGRLESSLGWLLAFLSRGSAAITIAMFHSVVSTDGQKAMLMAAAKHALRGSELDAFNDLMDDFRPRYGERSRLVHNVWGHSNDHPDKALWWKSADLGSAMAKFAAAPTIEEISKTVQDEDLSLKAMAYSVQDLEQVAIRLNEYLNRVDAFVTELINAHPAIASAATSSTNAAPIGDQPQLDLHQNSQIDPLSDRPDDQLSGP